jgi:S1-C subfamily serine protease
MSKKSHGLAATVVSAIFLACAPMTSSAQELKLPDVVEKVGTGVVTVEVAAASKTGEKSDPTHGTGFIISTDGYVVSSTSLLDEGSNVTIVLASTKRLPARVVGTDPFSRVALFKVESSSPLTALSFADSDRVRPGEPAFLVGDMLGLPQSVTSGVISAKDRVQQTAPYEFLQTDAAVSNSNGGGPLFNLNGEVVGMVFSIAGEKTDYARAALAVPANLIKRVVPKLQQSGTVARGWLGVMVEVMTEDIAHSVGLGELRGVKVNKLFPESPAGAAGVTEGDIIVQIGDAKIMRPVDVVRVVSELAPGTPVDVTVWRGGGERKFQAKLIAKPATAAPAAPPAATPPGKKSETVTPPAQPAAPSIERVEILKVGIYTSSPIRVIKDPTMATGQRNEMDQTTLVQETTTIPMKDDIWFGLDAQPVGSPNGANVPMTVVWRYPNPGIRGADGTQKLTDTYVINVPLGASTFYGFHVGDRRGLPTGKWTVELWNGNRTLASQTFTVVSDR